jgi:hypothetical protein
MKSPEKHTKPVNSRQQPSPRRGEGTTDPAHISPEDERDLRDATRAREEARRKGVYPWEWVKQEIEG